MTPPVWQTRISPRILLKLRFNMHMVKRWLIHPFPQYDWPGSQLEFGSSDLACTWSKRWLIPPVWQTRISPRILKLRFNMHRVKRWLTPPRHPNLQLFVSAGFHIGHHRGLSHERPISVFAQYRKNILPIKVTISHCFQIL